MDEKMHQHSQAGNSSKGEMNRNENYREERNDHRQSQKTGSSEYGQENREHSERQQGGKMNSDSNWKSQEGRSQSMQSEVNEDREMGNDVERKHTEGDEPNLGQSVQAEKDWQKSMNDGSRSGAMSSETGKGESQYNGPFKEGASENTSYEQGSSQYQNGEGQNQSKN